ncbi:MAG: 16S rRNA (uracil(1498)-N(3))-methyltransferase [Clostridiaceae bacterium]
MRRFFCDNIKGNIAVLAGDDAHHIARVLRMRTGDALSLCDGAGREFDAVINAISQTEVVCTIGDAHESGAESPCKVTLFQCLPKTGKFETIIQKCTELGVFAVVPVFSSRCVVVPDKDFDKKRERYQRVALEAAKQSRRAAVPDVLPLVKIGSIQPKQFDLFLIAYEEEETRSLKTALKQSSSPGSIGILIGPEGGLTSEEVSRLTQLGAVSVSLGKRILRTETAGMAMLAQTLYEVEP